MATIHSCEAGEANASSQEAGSSGSSESHIKDPPLNLKMTTGNSSTFTSSLGHHLLFPRIWSVEIRRDSGSLSCDLEVFYKGDREEFVKQSKNKIRQFGDLSTKGMCLYDL